MDIGISGGKNKNITVEMVFYFFSTFPKITVGGFVNQFNPSHAAIKILINATAAEFICENIFPTPMQVKKL